MVHTVYSQAASGAYTGWWPASVHPLKEVWSPRQSWAVAWGGYIKSQTAQSSHSEQALLLATPSFQSHQKLLGHSRLWGRLLSLLTFPGMEEVVVWEATDGVADGK